MFPLICVGINGWINSREAGDLRRYCAHYDVSVISKVCKKFLTPAIYIYIYVYDFVLVITGEWSLRWWPGYKTKFRRWITLDQILRFKILIKSLLVDPQKKCVGVLIILQFIILVRSHNTTKNNLHEEALITLNEGHSFGCGHLSRSICQPNLIMGRCESGTYDNHCVLVAMKTITNSNPTPLFEIRTPLFFNMNSWVNVFDLCCFVVIISAIGIEPMRLVHLYSSYFLSMHDFPTDCEWA